MKGKIEERWQVLADHPTLKNVAKDNMPKGNAIAYVDSLRGLGYENVTILLFPGKTKKGL